MASPKKTNDNKILIAVDDSENALRAVTYVGQLLGGLDAFKITLLHIIPEPEPDYFPSKKEKKKWLFHYKEKTDDLLENYRQVLIREGFRSQDIVQRSAPLSYPSIAECILAEREKDCSTTIVVGRQGFSRSEEFLFGSISNKIVNHARNCTVWVVE